MFEKSPDETAAALDKTIKRLEDDMTAESGDSDEYATMLNRLERLYKLKEKHAPKQVSPDTMLIVAGNLLGILIIVGYEHGHVIVSKAIGFAGRLR